MIRTQLRLEPTGRSAKSTASLVEKLRRESIRLTQVQDIAGCRIVVTDIAEQDRVVASLCSVFPGGSLVDRRHNPSYGYRAVHVIIRHSGNLVEIQVRTGLQHLWAEVSEKLSDVFDPAIKYGGGSEQQRDALARASQSIEFLEGLEEEVARYGTLEASERAQLLQDVAEAKAKTTELLSEIIGRIDRLRSRAQ
jgi:GTP pyrophosphokinase